MFDFEIKVGNRRIITDEISGRDEEHVRSKLTKKYEGQGAVTFLSVSPA